MEELYNQLYNDGKYTKNFEDFKIQFGSPEKSEKLYTALNEAGDYTKSFEDFKTRFIIPAKIQDSASADPAVESKQNVTGSESEKPLSAWQSIKNSFSNVGEQVGDVFEFWFDTNKEEGGGARAALDIATNSIYAGIFGQKNVDKYVEEQGEDSWLTAGLGTKKTAESIEKFKREQLESKETIGIIESVKKGDVAGALAGGVNALTSMIGSVIYGAGTLGSGFFMDYTAENFVEYNKLKAENLGISFDELLKSGEADNAIPVGMGAVSTALEFIGLGSLAKGAKGAISGSGSTGLVGMGSKYLAEKLIYNKGARATMRMLSTGATEFTTEILQHAADQVNSELGRVAGTDKESEIFKTVIDAVTSQEGLEAGLQGFIGGGGMVAGTYSAKSMNTIRTIVDGDKINKNINDLSVLRKQLNITENKLVKEGVQTKINEKESEIADSVRKGNDIYNNLTNNQISEIESLTDLADAAAFKITELNKQFRKNEISEDQYNLAVEGFKSEYEGARKSLTAMELEKNLEFARAEAESKGLKFKVYETTKAIQGAVNKLTGISKEDRQEFKDSKGNIHGFAIGNQILINKEVAAKEGAINVGSHEVLHPVFNKLIGNIDDQGKIVKQFRRAMTSSQRSFVDKKMKDLGYDTPKRYNTEYINVFSDALRKKQINYDKTTFEKIGSAIVDVFKPKGYTNVSFETGQDVYNFVKEFDASAEQGKLTEKAAAALENVDLSDAGLKGGMSFSKSLTPEQTTEVTNDILNIKQLAEENAAIAAQYGKEPIKGGKQTRLEQKVITSLKPIIEKVVSNRTKVLYDPIALDAKKAVSRQEFKESMRSDLEIMVLNEYNGSQDIEKFIVNRGYLRANNLAKRLGIESQEDGGIKSDVTAAKDVANTEDVQSVDRSGAVERGQATFDQLDLVDNALVSDIEKELSRELKTRSAKGSLSEKVQLNLNGVISEISWIEDFVNKELFKKILKKWGAIGESKGETKIPGAYIDFLNDKKNFDIIMKALPVKTIKKSYSKLFNLEKIGRELTAEGNPIYRIAPIDKKTFLQYFLDGKKTTILERQKQLAREIITPVAKEVLANYATTENLSALKEMQELAPDASLDAQAEIIIEAQLEQMQSQLDRYKSEKSGFDVIQFSRTVTKTEKQNIFKALNPLLENPSNNDFKTKVVEDIINGLDKVKNFKGLAELVWNAGNDTLNKNSVRIYRVELLKLLANKLNYSDTVKFLIKAINKYQKVYTYQQKVIGFDYSLTNLKSSLNSVEGTKAKAEVMELFLRYISRSIRTLKLDGITKNSQVYNQILKPMLGDPKKYGFSLDIDEEKNKSYILRDITKEDGTTVSIRLQGLTDVTNIKADFVNNVKTINEEAVEVRNWLLNEAKKAIYNGNGNSFIGFLSLISADQRGVIRKMNSAGFAMEGLAVKDSILEHETEAIEVFKAWKDFVEGKIDETKLINFLEGAKVNLVSRELDALLRKVQKEKGFRGKERYLDQRVIDFLENKKIKQFSKSKKDQVNLIQSSEDLKKARAMVNRPDAPAKGISIWDFDDTLATTKSSVLYTMPGTLSKVTEEEFNNLFKQENVYYHGTSAVVNEKFVNIEIVKDFPEGASSFSAQMQGLGKHYTKSLNNAKSFIDHRNRKDNTGTVAAVSISANNPKQFNTYQALLNDIKSTVKNKNISISERNKEYLNILKSEGFDSIAYKEGPSYNPSEKSLMAEAIIPFNSTKKLIGSADYKQRNEGIVKGSAVAVKQNKINATEFALKADQLVAKGAEFDFSEFSKVMRGAKGPMFEEAVARNKKFGNSNVYILTARPANSKYAIHEFLKGIGLDIKLDNIFGLGDGSAIAKANWVIGKVAEGYNDFYFADDAYKNVKAVQDVLVEADIKSKVHQAKVQFSRSLNSNFNKIIQDATKIDSNKTISEAKSKMLGKNKGGWRFFVPPSAEDFAGLMYRLLGKGNIGNENAKWFKKALFDPYAKGINNFEAYKQQTAQAFKSIKKSIKTVPKGLGKTNETGFTNDAAIRVYLWVKNGHEIPGLDAADTKELVKIVENNKDFKDFALQVENLLGGYQVPEKNWLAGTVTTDVINTINTSKREEFLQQWQANSDKVFSKDNVNKLRAAFGEDYVEALEDMLYRMKSGRNRPSGSNKLTNQFMNWVNDSVGTIMFFNTRSALLQTLSISNFINWGDNNPIQAAKAFANQKQFWADFSMIFNSDFLKQRRSGLKTDINADDIASAAESSGNKAKAALSAILKMGFLPTQIADSFAIAMGGSSFLRNRIDSYIKEGLSKEDAEAKAFLDFQEVAEETQQSSRPDRISQQQASPLGRVILAFANTPMQYMRLTKKAILDIKNKRGDLKTNISKIVYYTAIQNIIFASLQSAMFAAMFEDDDETLKEKESVVVNSMLDTLLRGMGIGGAIVSTIKNVGLEIDKQSNKPRPDYTQAAIRTIDLSPPLSSKLRKLISAGRAFSYKNVRDKMVGVSLENPAIYAGGQVVSALTNVPLDRAIKKADNIRLAMDNDTKLWQKIALSLGYGSWDVGLVEKEESKNKSKKGFGKPTTWKKTKWKKNN